jgi:Trp operon repressor
MKENAILCRIKILKALFITKISNRKLAKKINIHYNTI